MRSIKKLYAIAFLFSSTLIFFSCGMWKDFTTYFNTYYNAKTIFERAEEQILLDQKDVFLFRQEKINNVAFQDFTKVIEKCSKILQFDKESSYFDDALFMTGKAFYYQQEYAKAQRKFLELASISDSEIRLWNLLWLAKTNLQLRSFEEGLKLIEQIKKDAKIESDVVLYNNAFYTSIGFYVFREDYKSAIKESNDFLSSIDDEEISALVWYQLGRIYLLIDDKENALNAFASVLKFSPTFDTEFESRIEYGILLKELGRGEESENILFGLRDEGKFNNHMDRILNEIGLLYYEQKKYDDAVRTFKEVDSTYLQKQSAGYAQLMLGEVYEKGFGDYDSSYKYYNKASSSLLPIEQKIDAGNRVKDLNKYFTLKKMNADYDIQKMYLTNPNRFLRDSIDYDIAFNEYLEENRKKAEELAQQSGIQVQNPNQQQERIQPPPQQIQTQSLKDKDKEVTLVELIAQGKVKKPEKPKISIDSVNTLKAKNYYDLGSFFISEFDVPDSAFYYLNEVLANSSDSTINAKTFYALGTMYETSNQKEKADSLFQIVYDDYKKSPLQKEAGKKLGIIQEEKTKLSIEDDPSTEKYVEAEENYYNKNYRAAIRGFQNVYLTYPKSDNSPKAIYYIGMIHEELKEYDSAAFYYGILASKEYQNNPLSRKIFAKYTEYKNEKEKLEKELEEKRKAELLREEKMKDSLKAVTSQKDSIDTKKNVDDVIKKKNFDDELKNNVVKDSLKTKDEKPIRFIEEKPKTIPPDTTKKGKIQK